MTKTFELSSVRVEEARAFREEVERRVLAGARPVTLFGRAPGPTAQDWADVTGTISYEITTRLGARIPREYVN